MLNLVITWFHWNNVAHLSDSYPISKPLFCGFTRKHWNPFCLPLHVLPITASPLPHSTSTTYTMKREAVGSPKMSEASVNAMALQSRRLCYKLRKINELKYTVISSVTPIDTVWQLNTNSVNYIYIYIFIVNNSFNIMKQISMVLAFHYDIKTYSSLRVISFLFCFWVILEDTNSSPMTFPPKNLAKRSN